MKFSLPSPLKSIRVLVFILLVALITLLPLAKARLASPSSPSTGNLIEPGEAAPAFEPAMFFASYTVNALSDTGAGSGTAGDLRYCITQANAAGGSNTITFTVTGTITLASALPAITNTLTINGREQTC